jgi:hypothetical protein
VNDLKDIADHAAHQDYQWMFVAMFTILMVVIVVIWRWMTSDRAALASQLEKTTNNHSLLLREMMVVVVGNGIVMSEAKNVIAQAAKILERVEKKL